jgi:hypothetical protein
MREAWRRLTMGLATVTGVARRGFFIPYRHADVRATDYPSLEPLFRAQEPAFTKVLAAVDSYADALSAIGGEPAPAPRWSQDWFPGLDAAAAYSLVRSLKPARIVEIGSGHSTRFLARAMRDEGLSTRLTAIDPQPRAVIAGLPVETVRKTLQDAGFDAFAGLGAGDMVFVDSSHILMPGTDVDLILNGLLPRLPAGALLHVHDIFLPDAYPERWAWRGYNEQQAVALLLTGGWEMVFASHYVRSRMGDQVRTPRPDGAFEASLWLRKRA